MFEYNICNQADADLFQKQCQALENRIVGIHAKERLEDVDGILIQFYQHELGAIMVKNDMQVDALYVVSEFDLMPYFKK